MAVISEITLPSGATYDIKDATARHDISILKGSATGAMHYAGVTTTALADGSSTSPIKSIMQIIRHQMAMLLFTIRLNLCGLHQIISGTSLVVQAV